MADRDKVRVYVCVYVSKDPEHSGLAAGQTQVLYITCTYSQYCEIGM